MKALIAVSGLAGFVLFGAAFLLAQRSEPMVQVRIERLAAQEAGWDDQSRCRFEAERSATLDAGGDRTLRLEVGSGTLEVVGVAGLREVRAVGRACASHEELLEEIRLTGGSSPSEVILQGIYPESRGGWGNRYARLDLRVEVPEGMAGEIRDGSGELTISGLGALILEDGSGGARLEGIGGDLTVRDGSGELEILGVSGAVEIEDSSGEIRLLDAQGNVWIHDSSGEVVVRGVGGDVEIEDSSGDLDVRAVRGSVTLFDGSGEVDVQDVERNLRIPRDGSGDIRVSGIGGDFVVERDGTGSIRHTEVSGAVDVPRKRGRR